MSLASSRARYAALASVLLVVACGDASTSEHPAPGGGTQGPGTPIPGANDGDRSPSSPGTSAPTAQTPTTPPPAATEKPADPAPVTKKVLAVTWQGQETYYWCGPGSTRMALSTKIASPPSQTVLAGVLGTTVDGTDHIGLVANALNKYLPGSGYVSRPMADPPSQAQRDLLKKDILARIGAGSPIVANVISGWRPPGYPSGTIYHYVAVVGFDDGGAKVLIADPAAEGHGGGATWNNVPRTYWISLEDLGTWIGGKGYTG